MRTGTHPGPCFDFAGAPPVLSPSAGWTASFVRCRRAAATALTAAVMTLMSVGGFALTSDHIHLVYQRDILKAATDAATLAATRHLRTLNHTVPDEDARAALEPIARRYILANIPESRRERAEETLDMTLTLDRVEETVDIVASADLGGIIFGTWLYGNVVDETQTESGAERSANVIEIALAIDVTPSMGGTYLRGANPLQPQNIRMNIAKTATRTLLDALNSDNNAGGHVAVGLVPFNTTVNIGSGRTAWMSSADAAHKVFPARFGSWTGCIEHRLASGGMIRASDPDVSLTLPSVTPFTKWFSPNTLEFRPAERALIPATLPSGRTWTGENDWAAAGQTPPAQGQRSPHFGCPSAALVPLTNDIESVMAAVDTLRPWPASGGTMAHLGMVWGRRLLAPEWRAAWGDPRFPVDRGDAENKKVIVLLTDGVNAASDNRNVYPGLLGKPNDLPNDIYTSGYGGYGRASGQWGAAAEGFRSGGRFHGTTANADQARNLLNSLLSNSCTFAKDEGIEVFTIAAIPEHHAAAPALRAMLTDCATSPNHTFTRNTRPDDIIAAFHQIARRIQAFRLKR